MSDADNRGALEEVCPERLRAENERYGLPVDAPLSVLLKHIYANRDLVYAVKDMHIDLLERKLAVATEALEELATHGCQGHKDHRDGSPLCPYRMPRSFAEDAVARVGAVTNV